MKDDIDNVWHMLITINDISCNSDNKKININKFTKFKVLAHRLATDDSGEDKVDLLIITEIKDNNIVLRLDVAEWLFQRDNFLRYEDFIDNKINFIIKNNNKDENI